MKITHIRSPRHTARGTEPDTHTLHTRSHAPQGKHARCMLSAQHVQARTSTDVREGIQMQSRAGQRKYLRTCGGLSPPLIPQPPKPGPAARHCFA